MSTPDIDDLKKSYKKYIKPLLLYPLVNFVLAIPVTANRIQNWVHEDKPVFGLFLCHSIVYPLWGFCNAMMYFMSKETIMQLHPCNILQRLIPLSSSSSHPAPDAPKRAATDDEANAATVLTNPAALNSVTMDSSGGDMD